MSYASLQDRNGLVSLLDGVRYRSVIFLEAFRSSPRSTINSLVRGVRDETIYRLFNVPDHVLQRCPYGVAENATVMPLEMVTHEEFAFLSAIDKVPDTPAFTGSYIDPGTEEYPAMRWALRDNLSPEDDALLLRDLRWMSGLHPVPEYLPAWLIMLSSLKHRTAHRRPGRRTVYTFPGD